MTFLRYFKIFDPLDTQSLKFIMDASVLNNSLKKLNW